MKNISKIHKHNQGSFLKSLAVGVLLIFVNNACQDELPEAGSIPDATLPSANFSYKSSTDNYKEVLFNNLSVSSLNFAWDFGDGGTSAEKNPSHVFEAGEGTYSVKLIASDGNDVTSEITQDVEVVDVLIPEFACPSFESCDSNREVWGSYSGSGSPTPPDGPTGAKLNANSTTNILEQTIKVTPGTKYKITFWFVGDTSDSGIVCGNLLIADGNDNSIVYFDEPVLSNGDKTQYMMQTYIVDNGGAGMASDQLLFRISPGVKTGRYDLIEIKKID